MQKTTEEAYKEVEYTRTIGPYKAYREALEEVFDFSIIESFADLGCSNGKLMETIGNKYPHIRSFGFEYFQWAKDHASPEIREKIHLGDLGKVQNFPERYDIVNCSEVGEHIDPEYEGVFIDNLSNATKDILILTWSNDKSDTNGQHVNPKPTSYVIEKLEQKGLIYWPEATQKFVDNLKINLEGIGHNWWSKNLMVFKRARFADIKSRYFVQGISTDNSTHHSDLSRDSLDNYGKQDLQSDFKELTKTIRNATANGDSYSVLRASDGDYLFLREIAKGSAKPGKRALTKEYSQMNMSLHKSLFWHHDLITLNLDKDAVGSWRTFVLTELPSKILSKLFGNNIKILRNKYVRYGTDILLRPLTVFGILPYLFACAYSFKRGPVYLKRASDIIFNSTISCDAVYGLVNTKWLFKNYPDSIGIIAGTEKLNLIKQLSQNDQYRKYLGIDSFVDFLEVPQKGAADNVEELARGFEKTLSTSKAKIFLVGTGSSKIALIPLMRQYSDAVFIDIGAGMDALAGVVCQERPYFAQWTNFRMKDFDYSKVDFMDQGNPAWDNEAYKTEFI